jgi:hypothetical protein
LKSCLKGVLKGDNQRGSSRRGHGHRAFCVPCRFFIDAPGEYLGDYENPIELQDCNDVTEEPDAADAPVKSS